MRLYKNWLVIEHNFLTFGFKAKSYGLFIVCPKPYQRRYLEHERQHCLDFVASPFEYLKGYFFDDYYKLWAELRGYSHSHAFLPITVASMLNRGYGLHFKLSQSDVEMLTPICVQNDFKACKAILKTRLTQWEIEQKK